ncbi:Metallo-dependent phosphatase [Anaeromyces robustus]|uniref:Metallo-dependent phosphatase n=1 Tax=Anaeromyces robustus TaxID=1754192 RepID=A0A1Y1XK53_9FUNG|nr:Metallo-dependent phosphatase [Anaeromyces robustus]|eukprot:ORX85836.1 Metallo-dependent phosphatase [Anaeromyces robustus]
MDNNKNNTNNNELNRIIALGDIHGDYEQLIKILQHAKLIDANNNWIGKDTILVQVGDLVERGSNTLKVYETLINLREQAKEKGGIVYILIGNHEILGIQGNHHLTSTEDYEAFGGLEALEEAYSPHGIIGQFVRQEANVTMIIDDSLFVHAGLTPEYANKGIDKLNEYVREILLDTPSTEELYQLFLKNITHPIYTEPIFNEEYMDGPLWIKDFANKPEKEVCSIIEKTLEITNTKRMIVGHTPQSYGKIRTKCHNKFIIIDIGITHCIVGGGNYGYLEILKDKKEIWARYLN